MSISEPQVCLSGVMRGLLPIQEAAAPDAWIREGHGPDAAEAVASCAQWTGTFPLHRVRKGRRIEAICPMVAPSIENRGLWFTAAEMGAREPSLEALDEVLREAATVFERDIRTGDPRLRCLVVVLPGVRGARLLEATDPERRIKNELLERDVLVGEFFPSCPFATTFNPRLFALRSPAPMYVLRTFLETDWRFLCKVPAWQETYRERFGEPPAKLRHLGGPLWRLKEKLRWRYDAALWRMGLRTEEKLEES